MKRGAMIVGLFLLVVLISGCTEPIDKGLAASKPKLIEVYVDEDYKDPNNLKEIHIADIMVDSDGNISLSILDAKQEFAIKRLETALQEIREKGTLDLIYEEQQIIDGSPALVMMAKEILPSDPNYIYALQEELTMHYGLKGVIKNK